jgi:hypothetical protein
VTRIKFDADWVGGYAQLAAKSAQTLEEGARTMAAGPLTDESFGQLGRTLRVTESYVSVAGTLRDQLSRAVESLDSASSGLEQVTARYVDSDELTASTIHRHR